MKDITKFGIGTGLVLTVSLATALHATAAVRNVDYIANAFSLSEGLVFTQFVVPDQFVPDPEPVDDNNGEGLSENGATAGISVASTEATVAIALKLERGADLCERTPEAYQVDCLALNYRETADTLTNRGDYAEARKVLLDTADRLDDLVQSNRDRTKPRIQVKAEPDGPRLTQRALKPVKPESVATVKRQAIPILEEASTKLLRSASSGSTNYQRIAAAVDSNKVLLRSS